MITYHYPMEISGILLLYTQLCSLRIALTICLNVSALHEYFTACTYMCFTSVFDRLCLNSFIFGKVSVIACIF